MGKTPELCLTENKGFLLTKRLNGRRPELLLSLRQQYGKPTKPVKDARMAWKNKGENFSEALLKIRANGIKQNYEKTVV